MEAITSKNDAFSHAFAIWYWLSHNHEGQTCDKYAKMSSMCGEFNITNIPEIDFETNDFDDEDYDSVIIYHNINDENWLEYYNQFENYMNNEWDNEE